MLMFCSFLWASEPVILQTNDRAHIALHHYPQEGAPVLLAHGLSSNHRVWDLNSEISLARHLQSKGYDVWLIDFRGNVNLDPQRKKAKTGTFFEQGLFDIDSAVNYILDHSSFEQIHFVAYSLSGVSFLSYLNQHSGQHIQSAVFIGVPLDLSHPEPLMKLAGATMRLTVFSIPTHKMGRWISRFSTLPYGLQDLLWNEENIDLTTRHLLLNQIFSPMSPRALKPLSKMIRSESVMNSPSAFDLLRKQDFPILMISGRYDKITPPDRVLPYQDALMHPHSQIVTAGKMDGFDTDYGHVCLTMSYAATQEIFPLISSWLYNIPIETQIP